MAFTDKREPKAEEWQVALFILGSGCKISDETIHTGEYSSSPLREKFSHLSNV